jgi:hypothetical protein
MKLFSPLRIGEIELKNRIAVSPMCEYSPKEGHPQAWHLWRRGAGVYRGERRGRAGKNFVGRYLGFTRMRTLRRGGRLSSLFGRTGRFRGCNSRTRAGRQAPRHLGLEASPSRCKTAAGSRLRRVRWRLMWVIPCRTNCPSARLEKLSGRSGRLRNARWRQDLKFSRFTRRTDICCTNFCRR